ncbi:hypothetical protein Tco_0615686 [Tanacetum coccineum]
MSDDPLGVDISSLDPPELTPVIDEPTLLVTLPLPCTDILGDAIIDIDLLLGEHLDTLSIGDWEIDFNPSRDIEELESLLADDPVLVPRVFDEPLGNSDSMSRSSEIELFAEFGLDDSIPTEIDDMYHDSEGDILYFEQLLNEDTSALLPIESSSLDLPLPDPKQIYLREVERFDLFSSLTQSGGKTRVMETPSFDFHHMPSPLPAAYSPTEVIVFDEPLSNSDSMSRSSETSDLFEELIVEISLDDSIPIGIDDRYKGLKTKQKRFGARVELRRLARGWDLCSEVGSGYSNQQLSDKKDTWHHAIGGSR